MKNLLNDANNKLKVLTDKVRMDVIAAGLVPGAVVMHDFDVYQVTGVKVTASSTFHVTVLGHKRNKDGSWGKRNIKLHSHTGIGDITPPDADKIYKLVLEDQGQTMQWLNVRGNRVIATPLACYDTVLNETTFPKNEFSVWCYRRDFRVGDYVGFWDGSGNLPQRITEVREL